MTINRTKILKFNGKRKAESGKLLFFDFRLEWKTEPEGCGNSDGGQGADLLGSLEALGSLAVRGRLWVAGTPMVVKAQRY